MCMQNKARGRGHSPIAPHSNQIDPLVKNLIKRRGEGEGSLNSGL